MKINKSKCLFSHFYTIVFCFCMGISPALAMQSDAEHPHILVNQQDRKAILEKIRTQDWAAKIFNGMKKNLKRIKMI